MKPVLPADTTLFREVPLRFWKLPIRPHAAEGPAAGRGMSRGLAALLAAAALGVPAWGGPPFLTDDPEPVELDHLEAYAFGANGGWGFTRTGFSPGVEVNYGILPETQFHLIVPASRNDPGGGQGRHAGLGDTEVGVKFRFLDETDGRPQIGVFPLVELPTGRVSEGLGSGHTQVFLPVWLQKGWGPWTSYGGGGWWRNPGEGQRNWTFAGWLLQRDLSKRLTLGGEVFRATASAVGDAASVGVNVGGQVNFGERHHVLFSLGRNVRGNAQTYAYLAYQLTAAAPEGLRALLGRKPD